MLIWRSASVYDKKKSFFACVVCLSIFFSSRFTFTLYYIILYRHHSSKSSIFIQDLVIVSGPVLHSRMALNRSKVYHSSRKTLEYSIKFSMWRTHPSSERVPRYVLISVCVCVVLLISRPVEQAVVCDCPLAKPPFPIRLMAAHTPTPRGSWQGLPLPHRHCTTWLLCMYLSRFPIHTHTHTLLFMCKKNRK